MVILMTFKLHQMGFNLNHKTVLKLMNPVRVSIPFYAKRHGKRWKNIAYSPNLLIDDFTATALNQKWVTDVTELRLGKKSFIFHPLMDEANREIIAYNLRHARSFHW